MEEINLEQLDNKHINTDFKLLTFLLNESIYDDNQTVKVKGERLEDVMDSFKFPNDYSLADELTSILKRYKRYGLMEEARMKPKIGEEVGYLSIKLNQSRIKDYLNRLKSEIDRRKGLESPPKFRFVNHVFLMRLENGDERALSLGGKDQRNEITFKLLFDAQNVKKGVTAEEIQEELKKNKIPISHDGVRTIIGHIRTAIKSKHNEAYIVLHSLNEKYPGYSLELIG